MNTVPSIPTNGPDLRAQKLVASYMRAGYAQIEPPILVPAEPFLDLSGEDIRRRMFLTSDPLGRELCLTARPHHSGLARLSAIARRR